MVAEETILHSGVCSVLFDWFVGAGGGGWLSLGSSAKRKITFEYRTAAPGLLLLLLFETVEKCGEAW